MSWAFPSVQVPFVNLETGIINRSWHAYLQAFWEGTAARQEPLVSLSVGGSPWTYSALRQGHLVIQGGTVSLVQLLRKTTTISLGITNGIIPVQQGDQIIVTYTIVPTITFIPG